MSKLNKKKYAELTTNILTLLFITITFSTFSVKADPVDDWITTEMQKRNIPGLQLAIIRNNKITKIGSYGLSNLQDKVAVQNNTLFPINSMTKAFTGVALIQLAEKGVLSLDDQIGKHLPNLPDKWKALTIKQLMAHTSGLPKILSGRLIDLIVVGDPDASWKKVQELPFLSEPNTEFFYNQTGYVVIGKIIDKYVESGFPEFIAKKQFNVVGMGLTADAGFDYLEYVVSNQVRQYIYVGDNKYKNFYGEFPYILRTAAGMSSTASELAQYLIALQSGKLVSNLTLLWTPITLKNGKTRGFNQFENGYAMGWQIIDRPKHRAISASGANASTMIHYPEDNLSIVVLTNLLGSLPIQFVDEIAGLYIPEMKKSNGFGLPKNIKTLWQQLEAKGYSQAIKTAEALIAEQYITFSENELNHWGYSLISQEKLKEALEVFKLNTHLFPLSYNTYDSLAEGYWHLGNYSKAIEGYQKVLELKSDNAYAKGQIEKLMLLMKD